MVSSRRLIVTAGSICNAHPLGGPVLCHWSGKKRMEWVAARPDGKTGESPSEQAGWRLFRYEVIVMLIMNRSRFRGAFYTLPSLLVSMYVMTGDEPYHTIAYLILGQFSPTAPTRLVSLFLGWICSQGRNNKGLVNMFETPSLEFLCVHGIVNGPTNHVSSCPNMWLPWTM